MKTAISIISGYLGAGKSTLLKHVIANLDRKFAIIMNEFGDISIDTDIIQGKNVNIAELAGGCVCCSLTGEFEDAVKEIIEKYNPELIIVETTGVAEPDAIVVDVSGSLPNVALDSVITVVDCDSLARFPQIGTTGKIQIEMADILLLNKIDLVDEASRVDIKTRIKALNEKAPQIETVKCVVDINLLFGIESEKCARKVKTDDNKHPFESFSIEVSKPFVREQLEAFLKELPSSIYRLKGFVDFVEDSTYLLNYVAGRWDFTPMESSKKILVFIGENIKNLENKIKNKIEKL